GGGAAFNSVSPNSKEFGAALLPFGGELFTNNAQQYSYNIQNKLQFSKAFNNENRINALVGMELRSSTNKGVSNTVWGYAPDRGEVITLPTTPQAFTPITGSKDEGWGLLKKIYDGEWRKVNTTDNYLSVFATLAYSLKNRYVVNANIRNDASNRFGQDANHRIDPTYSFGFSWRASEEDFMKKYVKWITTLNFRGTYGIQGNAVTRISPDLILNQGKVANLYNRYQSTISQIPNPNLSWERTKSWNFGVDLEVFSMFYMNLEYYTRRSNAIVELELPYEYGITSMKRNGGIIHNRGIEYTLTFTPIQKRDYALSVSLNASKNWNEGGHTDIDVNAASFLSGRSDIVLKEGYPLSSFWSYSFAGLDGKTGEALFNLLDIPEEERSRQIDPTTYLVYSGQKEPYFTGGLSLSFRYKSLTLNTSFSLLLGNKKRLPSPYNQFASSYYMPDPYTNINRDLLNRWKEPGDEAHTIIPSLPKAGMAYIELPNNENVYSIPLWEQSDAMVVSGSFLRCRNIGLSWQMKREWCEKIYMKNLSLNFNMDNIFVIASKRFNGFDPEVSNSVLPRNYSLGINIGF
ncbi:SusC/RagA family TonB-linked outer membrane protein, partial [Bacteroides xylanisolvens]